VKYLGAALFAKRRGGEDGSTPFPFDKLRDQEGISSSTSFRQLRDRE